MVGCVTGFCCGVEHVAVGYTRGYIGMRNSRNVSFIAVLVRQFLRRWLTRLHLKVSCVLMSLILLSLSILGVL